MVKQEMVSKRVHFDESQYDSCALRVVKTLKQHGYRAYFVGGCVRDLLLGVTPKDFDVLTDARARTLLKLFPHARVIGRRFPIVHVPFGRHFIETTSWVTAHDSWWRRLWSTRVKATLEEDAVRRDFTINALYYDPCTHELFDPLKGMEDLESGVLRMIGDPKERLAEDPVRMIRALRLSAKTGLRLEPGLFDSLKAVSEDLKRESDQRIYLEWVKMLLSGAALTSFRYIVDSGSLPVLLPALDEVWSDGRMRRRGMALIERALEAIDTRLSEQKTVSLVFALSVFFWAPIDRMCYERSLKPHADLISRALLDCAGPIRIPLRVREGIGEIYEMQYRFSHRNPSDLIAMLGHPRFRASYDFFMLRAASDPKMCELALWWHDFLEAEEWQRAYFIWAQEARRERFQEQRGRPKGRQKRR